MQGLELAGQVVYHLSHTSSLSSIKLEICENIKQHHSFFSFWWFLGLNSGFHTCEAGTLPLEPVL
jgi:hypothetical protein